MHGCRMGAVSAVVLLLVLAAPLRADDLSMFRPASPQSGAIRDFTYLLLAITAAIFLLVEAVLVYSLVRFRRAPRTGTPEAGEPPQVYGSMPIEVAWTAAPALVVFLLVLIVVRTTGDLVGSPPPFDPTARPLHVTVLGRQWWWELVYERDGESELGFTTANELHVPVSKPGEQRPVLLTLLSADVCHSFWVPRLAGKTDLLPGRTNKMWFQADKPGPYLGQCAEYCGTQHAGMLLRVTVDTPEEFDRWTLQQKQRARDEPSAQQGKELFLAQSCINCHRVRGTPAAGTYAPDLTHLMSRQTLASGLLTNDRDSLRRWIVDPQKVKPGCLMPAFGLSDTQVDALVDYLLTLR